MGGGDAKVASPGATWHNRPKEGQGVWTSHTRMRGSWWGLPGPGMCVCRKLSLPAGSLLNSDNTSPRDGPQLAPPGKGQCSTLALWDLGRPRLVAVTHVLGLRGPTHLSRGVTQRASCDSACALQEEGWLPSRGQARVPGGAGWRQEVLPSPRRLMP